MGGGSNRPVRQPNAASIDAMTATALSQRMVPCLIKAWEFRSSILKALVESLSQCAGLGYCEGGQTEVAPEPRDAVP